MSTADQFLASGFNIFYDHAWRNFGLMFAYIVFNVSLFPFFDPLLKMHIDCSCVHCILYVPRPHRYFATQVQQVEVNISVIDVPAIIELRLK